MATKKSSSTHSRSKKSTHTKSSKASGKKTYATKAGNRSTTPPSKRWSAKVTTDSTKPAPGLFTKSAKVIAEDLAKKSVSPEGPGQGMRMLTFYENRAGKNLTAERKRTLENAKDLLRVKEGKEPKKKSSSKKASAKKSSSKKSSSKASNKKAVKKS